MFVLADKKEKDKTKRMLTGAMKVIFLPVADHRLPQASSVAVAFVSDEGEPRHQLTRDRLMDMEL